MIPTDVFASRAFAGANLYTFLLYAALGGALFFVPFQLNRRASLFSRERGAALLPFVLIMFIASRWTGALEERIGARLPLVGGALFVAPFTTLAMDSVNTNESGIASGVNNAVVRGSSRGVLGFTSEECGDLMT